MEDLELNDLPEPEGLQKEILNMPHRHKNIRVEGVLIDLIRKLDNIDIDELEEFIDKF